MSSDADDHVSSFTVLPMAQTHRVLTTGSAASFLDFRSRLSWIRLSLESEIVTLCDFRSWHTDWVASTSYTGRWVVEFGESTHPGAPVYPESGCGPEPFNIKTEEFVERWEVVYAALNRGKRVIL